MLESFDLVIGRQDETHWNACHSLVFSRKDADAKAMVFFGDRVDEKAFVVERDLEPVHESPYLDGLLALAEHIGIKRVISD